MLNENIKSILNNLKLCKDHEDVNQEDINKCFRYLMAYPENIDYSNIIDNKYKFSQYQWLKLIAKYINYGEEERVLLAEYIINHPKKSGLLPVKQLIIDSLKENGPYDLLCSIDNYKLTYDDVEKICFDDLQLSMALRTKMSDDNCFTIIDYIFDNHQENQLLSDNIRLLTSPILRANGIQTQKEHFLSRLIDSTEQIVIYWISSDQASEKIPNDFYRKYFYKNEKAIMKIKKNYDWTRIVKYILPLFGRGKLNDEVRTIVLDNYTETKLKLKNRLLKYISGDKCFDEVNSFFIAKDVLKELKNN